MWSNIRNVSVVRYHSPTQRDRGLPTRTHARSHASTHARSKPWTDKKKKKKNSKLNLAWFNPATEHSRRHSRRSRRARISSSCGQTQESSSPLGIWSQIWLGPVEDIWWRLKRGWHVESTLICLTRGEWHKNSVGDTQVLQNSLTTSLTGINALQSRPPQCACSSRKWLHCTPAVKSLHTPVSSLSLQLSTL